MNGTRWTSRILATALGLGLLLALMTQPAAAQRSALREVRNYGSAGGGLLLALPVGEFREHVDIAGGLDAFFAGSLDRSGALGIRVDGSFLVYDNLRDVAYLDGSYYSYPIDLNTMSYIASLRIGPQITLGDGPARLYGFWMGGVSYFATETSYRDYDCGCGSTFPSTTEWDDVNAAWEVGGGIQFALGRGHTPVLLDLGARYLHNGRTSYVPAQTLATGRITPIVSEANLVIYQIGISVGLR